MSYYIEISIEKIQDFIGSFFILSGDFEEYVFKGFEGPYFPVYFPDFSDRLFVHLIRHFPVRIQVIGPFHAKTRVLAVGNRGFAVAVRRGSDDEVISDFRRDFFFGVS